MVARCRKNRLSYLHAQPSSVVTTITESEENQTAAPFLPWLYVFVYLCVFVLVEKVRPDDEDVWLCWAKRNAARRKVERL